MTTLHFHLPPRDRALTLAWRGARALVAAIVVVVLATLSGCCEIQKQPGRCGACCYDNCIIPAVGTSSAALPSSTPSTLPGAARPRAMAY